MNQALSTKMKAVFFHPFFLIFITPIAYLLTGTIYAAQISSFSLLPFIGLYLFMLINQFLEKIIRIWLQKPTKALTLALLSTEALNLIIISSFALSIHLLVGLLLLFYSTLIQSQVYLIKLELKWVMYMMKAIFKGGILTYISFFVQLSFIPNTIFLWSIPFILLALVIEIIEYPIRSQQVEQLKQNRSLFLGLLVALYLSSFSILWLSFGYFALLLLLSLPAAWSVVSLYRVSNQAKPSSIKIRQLLIFSIVFLLSFALVISTKSFF
jgi:hypothetical protein